MSIHDETWDKCPHCGQTIKTFNSSSHENKKCLPRRYYAGVGSRKTPVEVCDRFTKIASYLEHKGYTLRSGGADGADLAFEKGVYKHKEIYLPWKGFNKSNSIFYNTSEKAVEIASKIHPAWEQCSDTAKKLHARNIHQIAGRDFVDFVDFVVCWTENGLTKGGTATAIVYARRHNIPIFNFGEKDSDLKLWEFIKNE
jgi:hypothetical protein